MKGLSFNHPEELLRLWPDLQPDYGKRVRSRITPWWQARGSKRGGGYNEGAGYGVSFPQPPRNQRALVKALVATRTQTGPWYKHGMYLQREGANTAGALGRGFDAEHEQVDLKTLLAQWQRAGDRHHFRIILSPEHSDTLDLHAYTRQVMHAVARDLGKPLEWAAIDHHNTGHAHVHVVLRGKSEGQTLTIARMYLQSGIKGRAQAVATRLLGQRTEHEIGRATAHAIVRRGWSQMDTELKSKMRDGRVVDAAVLTAQEQARLAQLAERGLAWREGAHWRMSSQWEAKQMDERNITRTPHEREREPEGAPPKDQQRERQEQEAEEQHRRAVIVDELEQDLGWGR